MNASNRFHVREGSMISDDAQNYVAISWNSAVMDLDCGSWRDMGRRAT
jgi:hypothetical protein